MPAFPVDEFFPAELITPATYTGSVDGEVDIEVLFENDPAAQRVLNQEFVNGGPRAYVRARDVPNPRRGDVLVIHPPIAQEDTEDAILDETSDTLLAEGQVEYKVHTILPTEYGITELMLSRD